LFDEDYVAIDGLTYIERIDEEFVNFPHMPELWKSPRGKGSWNKRISQSSSMPV